MKKSRFVRYFGWMVVLFLMSAQAFSDTITLYYPPGWKAKAPRARAIASAVSETSGLMIRPRIAKSYPEIVQAFSGKRAVLVYVGSFVQAILHARNLSMPIVQGINGQEFYNSVMIAPKSAGDDPVAIIAAAGGNVAYTKGASSGESGAKGATSGKAFVATNNHSASVNAVRVGKAQAAFVKNWWWESHRSKFPAMQRLEYPDVSDHRHPDYVLSANKAILPEELAKIRQAVLKNTQVFGVEKCGKFTPGMLEQTLSLMKKGKIDPVTYSW